MTSLFSSLRAGAALALIVAVAGCASDSWAPGREPERKGPPPAPVPDMAGEARFFSERIEAELSLGRSGFPPRETASREGRRREPSSGPFQPNQDAAVRVGGRPGGGGRPPGRPFPAHDGPTATGGTGAAPMRAAGEPPVQLRLRLTNHGADAADVEVTDFDSRLGNFVVQPRHLVIPPGESMEADPMTSELGVDSGEIPVVVGIRVNGEREKQTVVLRVKPGTAPASPPAASP
jgi:hypothetical protein